VRPRAGIEAWRYRTWAAIVPLYAVGVAVFFVAGRYRLPLLMPLAITAAGAITRGLARARAGEWRVAFGLVPVAAAAALAWWPLGLDDGRLEEQATMASALAGEGRTTEAIARAAALDGRHPQPGTVHYRVAVALQARGDLAAAEGEVRRALRVDPNQPEAHATLGQILAATGRTGEARHHMLRAAAGGAGAAGAARWIIDDAIAGRDASSAVFAIAELARTAGLDPGVLTDLGRQLLEARRGDLAEPYYLALAARAPRRADVAEALGLALIERGRPARAAQALERAIAIAPEAPSAHLNLAIAYVQIDRQSDALREARQALALRADYAQAQGLVRLLEGGGR